MRAIRSAIRPSIRSSFGIDIVDELQALITSLFSAGEQGAFYIPRPVVNGAQALFQDSAGTVPVAADGDPVGLMIDQSKGLQLGAETVTTNSAVMDGSSGFTAVTGDNLVIGKNYKITYRLNQSSGTTQMEVGSQNLPAKGGAQSGIFTGIITATNTRQVRFYSSSAVGTVSEVSVRELAGNHASQSTSAARPTYNDFAIGGDGVDDSMVSADFGNPAGVTMICAIKIAAGQSTFAVLFGLQDSTESRDNMIARVAADGSIDIIFTLSNGSKILGNIGNLGTEYIIFTLSFNNGVAKAYVNGVSVFSETGVSGALGGESNTLLLFSDINGTRQSEVDIKGFALASYHLDDEKRTATESYFASLAGVTL